MRTRPAALVVAALCTVTLLAAPAQAAASDRALIDRWSAQTELSTGTADGVVVSGGTLRLGRTTKTLTHTDPYGTGRKTTWAYGSWTSPWSRSWSASTRLVPSWAASSMPNGTWLRVSARVRKGSAVGGWDTVGDWAYGTGGIRRASGTAQTDDRSAVAVDTVRATPGTTFDGWQVRVQLLRKPGTTATPIVDSVGGIASTYATRTTATSATTMTAAKVLAVPQHSQMIHRGHHREWDGGGAAWCSPTSMSMVLRYQGTGPSAASYANEPSPDGFVDHAARYSYDNRYDGTGNWGFTAAYAGRYGLDSFVTRLYDLSEAEAFIKAGIPLVASLAFERGGLTGSPLTSTPGHMLVVVGFTKDGRVVVNDPAAPSNGTVRRTYDRAQFEKAWLEGGGGIVYVARKPTQALPAGAGRW